MSKIREIIDQNAQLDAAYKEERRQIMTDYEKNIAPFLEKYNVDLLKVKEKYADIKKNVDKSALVWEIQYVTTQIRDDGMLMHNYRYKVTFSKYTSNRTEAKDTKFEPIDLNGENLAKFSKVITHEFGDIILARHSWIDDGKFHEIEAVYKERV